MGCRFVFGTSRIVTSFCALLVCGAIQSSSGQVLTNGGRHGGSIPTAGATESWSFTSPAGANVMLRIGATNFPPRLRLFDSSNVQIAEVSSPSTLTRDLVLSLVTTNGGNYTVLASSATAAVGNYAIYFAQMPGGFLVPNQDEGGALASGASNAGNITVGDLDMWHFTAGAGSGFMVRMGGAFTPWLRVYSPSGALVADGLSPSTLTRDVVVSGVATNAGVYTVVASSTVSSGVGLYALTLALAPAEVVVSIDDQGGELLNGVKNLAAITVGDLDVWRFSAAAGDMVHLRMGGAFTPWIRLYGVDGELVGEAVSPTTITRDVFLERRATNAGVYIVVTSSTVASGVGNYELTLARVPADFTTSVGDEGGLLVNGAATGGNISVGDLDVWRFEANSGDAIVLRMGGAFTPKVQLYEPDGSLLAEAVSATTIIRDVTLEARANGTGTFMVIASSTVSSGNGAYSLNLLKVPAEFEVSPGDQGGEMISGVLNEGELTLGDIDVWNFEAAAGQSFFLRIGSEFAPRLRVYGPSGELVGAVNSPTTITRDLWITATATNAGNYVVVAMASVSSGIGEYDLHLVLGSGGVEISPEDQGGTLMNGATNVATMLLGDLDAWTFLGTVGDSNVLRVTATNFAPWVRLYGPEGTLVAESAPATTITRSAQLIYELTANPGEYTVVVSSGVSGQSGTYSFKQSRWAPDLNVPQNEGVNEGEPVFYTLTAQDPDEPVKPLQFTLLSGPPQAVFAVAGPTNATIGWSTGEIDGPVTNTIVVKVTDVVNGRTFSRTNQFDVVVREINVAPLLTVPANQTIDEVAPLAATATASDIDLPANPLTFSLVDPPEGMIIHPTSGAIQWTPSESEGPSSHTITVVVKDESPFAANEKNLSVTNSFTVVVREVNQPPQVTVPSAQTFDELTLLNVVAGASDGDLPANALAFSLIDPPQGMVIHPTTGAIGWTPTEAQGPASILVKVRVTDSNPAAVNEPALSATNSFSVTVSEVNGRPVLPEQVNRNLDEENSLSVANAAADSDVPVNALSYVLAAGPTNATLSAAGVISWTPTEAQGPGVFTFTTVVTDNGSPASTATNTFTVTVAEINAAPTIGAIANANVRFGEPWSNIASGSDVDLPANQLTYSLEEGPTGVSLVAGTGALSWSPLQAQVGVHTVRVRVTDNGTPALHAETSFQITVGGEETRLEISRIAGGLVQISIFGNVGLNYRLEKSPNLQGWEQQSDFRLTSSPLHYIDPEPTPGRTARFYQLRTIE